MQTFVVKRYLGRTYPGVVGELVPGVVVRGLVAGGVLGDVVVRGELDCPGLVDAGLDNMPRSSIGSTILSYSSSVTGPALSSSKVRPGTAC